MEWEDRGQHRFNLGHIIEYMYLDFELMAEVLRESHGVLVSTVFCRINRPGAEAENEPLTLFDLNENHSGNSCIPVHLVLGSVVCEIWPGKVKSRGMHLFKQVCLFGKIWYSSMNIMLGVRGILCQ